MTGWVPALFRASMTECRSAPGFSLCSGRPKYDSKLKSSSSPVIDCSPSCDDGSPGSLLALSATQHAVSLQGLEDRRGKDQHGKGQRSCTC